MGSGGHIRYSFYTKKFYIGICMRLGSLSTGYRPLRGGTSISSAFSFGGQAFVGCVASFAGFAFVAASACGAGAAIAGV